MSSESECKKRQLNRALLLALLTSSLVTAMGYTAWSYVTYGMNLDWTKKHNYIILFLVVAVALIVANLVFTLIFQRSQLITCETDTSTVKLEKRPIFL